jgi:hypothetical protein
MVAAARVCPLRRILASRALGRSAAADLLDHELFVSRLAIPLEKRAVIP